MTVNMVGIGSGHCPVPPMLALAVTPFHASGREMKCMARRGLTHLKFKVLAKSKLFPALFFSLLFAAAQQISSAALTGRAS